MTELSPTPPMRAPPSGRRDPWRQVLLLLGPALAVYCAFAVYPALDSIHLSVMKWDGLSPQKTFVGLDNYRAIFFDDPVFWVAFRNSVVWMLLSVTIPPLLGLGLALGLNQPIFGRTGLRAIFYLPAIVASIAVATMWRWMYDPFFGVVNATLTSLGLDGLVQDWLGDKSVALYSVFVAYVWQTAGISMVLFLAGLQTVSKTLIEAARIDGAGRLQIFRHVTLPALRPTLTIVLVLATVNSLKAFDIIYGTTQGGPGQSTQLLALWTFWQSLQIHDFGRGNAIAVVLFAITIAIVVPYLRWSQRREEAS